MILSLRPLLKALFFSSVFLVAACDQGGTVSGKISDARARNDGPPIWVVKDVDSTLYLYGTVHLLPSTLEWERPDMLDVFEQAGTVYFEVDSGDKAQLDALVLTSSLGMYRDGQRLSDKLDSYQLKLLDAAANNGDFSLAAIDSMRPWLASEFLTIMAAVDAGLDPGLAADEALKSRAKRQKKNILYLETIESQIRLSADQPEFVQMTSLADSLTGFNGLGRDLVRTAEAWSVGSTDFLTTEIIQATKVKSPDLYQSLFTNRNAEWSREFTKFMEGSGTGLAAIGIGHLLGEDNLQSFMTDRGYEVSRYYSFQGPPVIKPAFTPTYQDPDVDPYTDAK